MRRTYYRPLRPGSLRTAADTARVGVRIWIMDLRSAREELEQWKGWFEDDPCLETKQGVGRAKEQAGNCLAMFRREWKHYREIMAGRPVKLRHHWDPPRSVKWLSK